MTVLMQQFLWLSPEGVTSIGGRTRCLRKKTRKRVSKSGVGADREKGIKFAKNGVKGSKPYIQTTMIRVLAMRSYMERIGNLIFTSNQRQKTSELKLQIHAKHKKYLTRPFAWF